MSNSTKTLTPTQADIWLAVLADLRGQTTAATFNTWLASTRLISIQQSLNSPPLYTVEAANSQAVDWLEHRLKDVIERTLANIVGEPVAVAFVAREHEAYEPLDVLDDLDEPDPEKPDAEFRGAYHDKRNAIIQPNRIEAHSQYFRRKWRPLLGPLLSELIRELRQRCYHGKGKDTRQRNQFKTTYKELARALGVSERTIIRALSRDETGNFENKYLGYFIKNIEILKTSDGRGKIRNVGTRFVIYIDEPLTPEDEQKLSDLRE